MEHISTVVDRSMTRIDPAKARKSAATPKSLVDLVHLFQAREAEENPDLVLDTKAVRMTADGDLTTPTLRGQFALTDWSRGQLASLLGLRWERFSENATGEELAEEVNRRLGRATGEIRLRTTKATYDDIRADGTVTAVVSPGYSPVSDLRVVRMLSELLAEEKVHVQRFNVTPMTTSYVLGVGAPMNPKAGSRVGDIQGSLLVRNSGTGFASLLVSLAIQRLVCLNGMVVEDEATLKRTHRGIDDARLRSLLATAAGNLGSRVRLAGERLVASADRMLGISVADELERLLVGAKLARRLLPDLLRAYEAEPHASAFGVAQAITLAAQSQAPELRLELERLAGRYLEQPN